MEYYASLRTEAAIQAAEVAVVLLAADDVVSEQDKRVITQVIEAGRALVIAFNKWDALDEDRRLQLEREIERDLARVRWASRVNLSRSEEHTSELQSRQYLVCRILLEKKK